MGTVRVWFSKNLMINYCFIFEDAFKSLANSSMKILYGRHIMVQDSTAEIEEIDRAIALSLSEEDQRRNTPPISESWQFASQPFPDMEPTFFICNALALNIHLFTYEELTLYPFTWHRQGTTSGRRRTSCQGSSGEFDYRDSTQAGYK